MEFLIYKEPKLTKSVIRKLVTYGIVDAEVLNDIHEVD